MMLEGLDRSTKFLVVGVIVAVGGIDFMLSRETLGGVCEEIAAFHDANGRPPASLSELNQAYADGLPGVGVEPR